jgi:phosphotriesterase-related protein
MEILTILDKAGADLSRVVMSHLDRTGFLPETRLKMAETGCCLEYDGFGAEPFYPLRFGVFDRPSDVQRIRQIIDLVEKGYLSQVLISHDICMKIRLTTYGGIGYAHILNNVLPQMRARGMSDSEIRTILVDNPKRFTVCMA